MFSILGRSIFSSALPTPLLSTKLSQATTTIVPAAGYATAASKGRKRPALSPAQLKDEALKKLLYPRLIGKPRINPVGLHRREVNRALRRVVRSAEAHETIERAWQLHKRQLRESRETELQRKYESMKNAMDKLKELDTRLYNLAAAKVDPRGILPDDAEEVKHLRGPAQKFHTARVQGLFPREMWMPTDTPKKDGWNYNWTPPPSTASSAGDSS
ncbi:hypothetical protein M407DRAFT_176464 [Tulasnella calospora MUT 4182]|uniref:Large ribosomal subunit protein mL40 n=1 Tax=Tulasnella calospora MUT 4182 TaxID=1051891 RepID=A0A0C3L4N6_9AGAM|nr:hypothetical protein M407DRAFT_176464 [Tulasnella calospora MUT 4182]